MVEPARGVLLTPDDARRVVDTFLTMQRQLGATGARIALPITRLFQQIHAAAQEIPDEHTSLFGQLAADPHSDLQEQHIGTDTAAAILGTTPANVRDLARRGTLPGRHVSGRWVFDRYDVDAEHARRRYR